PRLTARRVVATRARPLTLRRGFRFAAVTPTRHGTQECEANAARRPPAPKKSHARRLTQARGSHHANQAGRVHFGTNRSTLGAWFGETPARVAGSSPPESPVLAPGDRARALPFCQHAFAPPWCVSVKRPI